MTDRPGFEEWCNEVRTWTCYNFTRDKLQRLYDDGHTAQHAIDLGEWKLDEEWNDRANGDL